MTPNEKQELEKKEREKMIAQKERIEKEEEYARYKLKCLYKLKAKMDFNKTQKTRAIFSDLKESLLIKLCRIETLLITIDKKMYGDRNNLVTLLKYVGGGIEDRERNIKKQLASIAMAEMRKGRDEDLLWNQTLKTIEIVNINDMAIEKQNLEKFNMQLSNK